MEDKRSLLHRITVCDFILNETTLYLDTHPDCAEALEYFQRYAAMQKEARAQYATRYGPITREDVQGDRWQWAEGPWPWELD